MKDAVDKVKTPEFHSAIVAPLLAYLWELVSPYIYALAGLLIFLVVGVLANFGFLIYVVS